MKLIKTILLATICTAGVTHAQEPNPCLDKARADARLDPIRSYFPEYVNAPTLAQRANRKRVTAAQKKAIEAYDEDRQFCEDLLTQSTVNYSPTVQGLAQQLVQNGRTLRASLYSGELTYGQFVSQDAQNASEKLSAIAQQVAADAKLAQEQQRIQQQQQLEAQAREQEAQERQRERQAQYEAMEKQQRAQNAIDLMAIGSRMMQASRPVTLAPAYSPVITNCHNNGYGNTSCTSY